MNMNQQDIYESRDFYLSVCLLASGCKLIDVVRNGTKTCTFVFQVSPEKAKEIIRKHWNLELLLPSRSLVESINELKTRIYNED